MTQLTNADRSERYLGSLCLTFSMLIVVRSSSRATKVPADSLLSEGICPVSNSSTLWEEENTQISKAANVCKRLRSTDPNTCYFQISLIVYAVFQGASGRSALSNEGLEADTLVL